MGNWTSYFAGKRVWVTGASSGIGRAIAEALGAAGVSTVVSARREDRLNELASRFECVRSLVLDLSDFDSIEEKVARAWDLLGGVDVLINNAGRSHRFLFAEAAPDVLKRIININLTGTMLVTRAILSRMLAAGGGHLVTVTSLVARIPMPMRSAYAASKTALHGLFDCIRSEVEARGIPVTIVVPGVVNTEISKSAATADGTAYGITDANQANGISADVCAERILNGVARKRREFSVGMTPLLHFATFLRRNLPGLYFRIIARAKVHGK